MIEFSESKTKKCPGITSFFIKSSYDPLIVNIIKESGTAVFDKKTKLWEVPLTSLSFLIDALTDIDDIKINLLQEKKKEKIEDHKLIKYKVKPFKHQIDAINYGLEHKKWLLLDDPGLGKSATIIHIAEELKKQKKIKHCLIVCGINTLKFNWKREIEKHSDCTCRILGEKVNSKGKVSIGSVAERLKQLKEPIKEFFVITNVETLRNAEIVKAINKNKPNSFDLIVVDEIHVIKNPSSQQSKGLIKLNKSDYAIGATGTLLSNSPVDAYLPLKWIGEERSSYSTFKYCYCNYTGHFNNILVGYKNIDLLQDQLSYCTLRRRKELLNLAPKTVIKEVVEMEPSQASFYENIQHGVKDQVDKVELTTASILSLITRLRQATTLPSILTTENIPSAKIDRACDLAEQIISSGNKVVIFSVFKEPAAAVAKQLEKYGAVLCTGDVEDTIINKNIERFQSDDSCKVFVGTFSKVATGITLTAASYMICLDSRWTASQNLQAEDRIHRIGSKDPVFIYYLITKDTIDERVEDVVLSKAAISEYTIDNQVSPALLEKLREILQDLD